MGGTLANLKRQFLLNVSRVGSTCLRSQSLSTLGKSLLVEAQDLVAVGGADLSGGVGAVALKLEQRASALLDDLTAAA